MATLLLSAAGGALGGALGPIGAIIGRAAGSLLGGLADRAITNALTPAVLREGPRLTTTDIQTSTEGSPINRIYGRARLTGQIIWATRYQEFVSTETAGGKGGGGRVETTVYSYRASFAIGLCEGPISGIGRIWADGSEIDQMLVTFRVHAGTATQAPDPLISAKEGVAPAYRGLAYIVFELMDLTDYGNRIPQISVEVYRAVGKLEPLVEGVALIAGNEFGFDTQFVKQTDSVAENRHTLTAGTDFSASLDRLQQLAPNCRSVMLVCPWFGDDLRAGHCTIRPKVDSGGKVTEPISWRVCGVDREHALVMSTVEGKPAYGGSPNDASVIRAIADLKARGFAVTLLPFIMMDIPGGNGLPDPDGGGEQGAYPWRGRITCHPAPGRPGTVDKTGLAGSQVAAFLGTAVPADFSTDENGHIRFRFVEPAEGGEEEEDPPEEEAPEDWGYRRFVLHYAYLAALAGGVDALLIGSEMNGLSTVRESASSYPFVNALAALAADVRSILGGSVKLSYAADWTEYNGHRPGDGSGDVYFHLDPLWSNGHIDFVGIDNYMPLADWRDGSAHLDFDPAGPTTTYDPAYLMSQVEGGEAYDWYYADKAGRDGQNRLPITDGAYGKPWTYRQKDIRAWWNNYHYNRPGGVEAASPTGWVPQGKPVRFIEMGCPATDKGANQPNVFPDPKSSESAFPWYSNRARDDVMGRAWLEAMLGYWGDPGHNPVSSVYGGGMIDLENSHVWAWDSRPWPTFPLDLSWGDAPNWENGHWINGRLGLAPAQETIAAILADYGFALATVEPIPAVVDGVTIGAVTSARAILDALAPCYQFDGVESDGVIKFQARLGRAAVATVTPDDLVLTDDQAPTRYRRTRAQETELPDVVRLRYGDIARDDQDGGVEARRATGASRRVVEYSVPATMAENLARRICDIELHAAWIGREKMSFALPPSRLALDAGDVIGLSTMVGGWRISDIADGAHRVLNAFAVDPMAHAGSSVIGSPGAVPPRPALADVRAILVDGPLLSDADKDHAGYAGAFMAPWRSGVALYRSPSTSGFQLDSSLPLRATMGVTIGSFPAGPLWRWDRVSRLEVELFGGSLASEPDINVLAGRNGILVEGAGGEWELLQFANAEQLTATTWRLTNLLRGQRGTEHAMGAGIGARVMLVDAAVQQTGLDAALVGLDLNWKIGPLDRDIGSPDYRDFAFAMTAKARRPLAPVHLVARRHDSGDFALSWLRRTRIGGDNWDQPDVPIGEAAEAYDLEILDTGGTTVLRTVSALASPSWTYTAAMQVADFGALQTAIKWRVYQLSTSYGRGIAAASL